MRTFMVVFALIIAVPLASGTFQPTREVDFWRTTNFDLTQARRYLSNLVCQSEPELYAACLEAYTQAGRRLKSGEFSDLPQLKPALVNFDDRLKRLDDLASQQSARFPKEMIFGTMANTVLHHFDAHANLIAASYLEASFGRLVPEVAAIGIDEEINGAGLFVRRVYENTPARKAGLKVNDRIVSIQGEAVLPGRRAIRVLRRLAQPAGSEIRLDVEREGQTLSLKIRVERLKIPDVQLSFVQQDAAHTYALATIRNFSHGVCNALAGQMRPVAAQIRGLILDVRGNMGGSLIESACVMSLFSARQEFVRKEPLKSPLPAALGLSLTFGAKDAENWREGLQATRYPNLPLVVLINSSSASASEMLAAALQDFGRAWIVGEPSFGKGSTQGVVADPGNPNLRLLYTVSRYYRPGGGPLQLIGVTPDLVRPFRSQATAPDREFLREGDIYGDLLAREQVPAWSQPRPRELSRLNACVQREDAKMRALQLHQDGFEDFEKSTALAVLRCTPAT